jgi:putative NADH-flavin reductase
MNRRDALGLAAGTAATAMMASTSSAEAALAPILVIAATARSAPEILAQGLAEGRKVTALARSPEKIEATPHPNLKIVKGDVYDVASLAAAMTGAESVISLVGPRVVDHSKEVGFVDVYSVGTATIISAMRRQGNRRLIAVSSGGPEQIPPEKPATGDPVDNWVWNARNLYGDMQRMEKIIAVSDLETVILRARNFGAGPRRGNLKLKVHDDYTDFDQYRDRAKRTPGERSRVTYADFAALCLGLAQGERFLGKAVGVYSDVPT